MNPVNPPVIDRAPIGAGATGAPGSALGTAGQAVNSPATAAQMLDQADIRSLDVPAALQILLFEVADACGLARPLQTAQSPDQVAGIIVDAYLQNLPPDDPSERADHADLAWQSAVEQAQIALQTGIDRALAAVGAWRAVSPDVIASLAEARGMINATLGEESGPLFLLRPEWLGLAPRIERFRRRRRAVRRRLQDPDYRTPL